MDNSANIQFKVGDKLVDYGQVHRIFKIQKGMTFNSEPVDYIYYRPYFKKDKDKSFSCRIPMQSIKDTKLRRPVTKEKMKQALDSLNAMPKGDFILNVIEATECFKENDPCETANLLKILWMEKNDEERKFTVRKKMIYADAMRHIVEEMAVVHEIELEKAEKKVLSRLRKMCPEKKESMAA